ncbi:hypothetical protein [Acinetobacter sp.]|uniref:hypothetical protein n=1 Tax=Acinetobacter sp. TaxID=472 RepID=UPI003D066301
MSKINHNQLAKVLQVCYKAQVAPFLWGAMGIGKSSVAGVVAKYFAKQEERKFMHWNETTTEQKTTIMANPAEYFVYADIRLSYTEGSDLKGLPDFFNGKDVVDWKPVMLFKTLSHKEAKGIIMFDEMNLAGSQVLSGAYQIVNDKQIGEYPINKDVFIMAAGNRAEDRGNTYEMGAPLRNRFVHFELMVPSVSDWCEQYAIPRGLDARIIGYLQFRPSHLFTFTDNKSANAFATPRTWEKTSQMIRFLPGTSRETLDMVELLSASAIGDGVATEFANFLRVQDKLDIKSFLKNPEKAEKLEDVSQKWALVTGIVELYRTSKKKDFEIDEAFQIVSYFDPEFGMLMLRMMKQAKGPQNFLSNALLSKAYKSFVEKHISVLKAAA